MYRNLFFMICPKDADKVLIKNWFKFDELILKNRLLNLINY